MNNPKSPFPEPKLWIIIAIVAAVLVFVVYGAASNLLHDVLEKARTSDLNHT